MVTTTIEEITYITTYVKRPNKTFKQSNLKLTPLDGSPDTNTSSSNQTSIGTSVVTPVGISGAAVKSSTESSTGSLQLDARGNIKSFLDLSRSLDERQINSRNKSKTIVRV